MAVAAGPLHDIAMLHVDPQILDPDTALTPRQRRQWHPHPLVSTAMVARHDVYPPAVGRAVGKHQECLERPCHAGAAASAGADGVGAGA